MQLFLDLMDKQKLWSGFEILYNFVRFILRYEAVPNSFYILSIASVRISKYYFKLSYI